MPPYNGSGTFTPYTPGNPVITGTVISSTAFNATQSDIAAGLSNAMTRDGQSPATANLPMGGQKLTGLGAGTVSGDSLRWEQLFSQGVEQNIASAATTDIGGLNTTVAQITGTTTITSFGTNYNGPRFVRFAGALTLTHNASTLILPGAANITTAAGDRALVTPIGNPASGWQVLSYEVAALAPGTATIATIATTLSGTVAIANGGTGSTTAAAARSALGTDDAANITTGNIAAARITNALNASGSAPLFACRAWVNFNGTGTPAIRASGNVSSITDNGAGDYTVNFTAAMSDVNFCAVSNRTYSTTYTAPSTAGNEVCLGAKTTSSQRLYTGTVTAAANATWVATDPVEVCLAIFR